MANELVKRMVKKDGSQRISFYREDYAENPRDITDEPLHCNDWSRDYSIMNKQDVHRSDSADKLLRYLLRRFGDDKKAIAILKENGKADEHKEYDNALIYDKSRKEWILYSWVGEWTDRKGIVNKTHWGEECAFVSKIDQLEIADFADYLNAETIDYLVEHCMTDKVKMMSYSFGYYGGISFSHDVSTNSEGICWLEKDEFLKYSGNDEEYWNGKTLDEIEFLLGEIKAWCDKYVYGFVIEDAVRIQGIKTYYNGEREDEPYIDTQWEESDSCWDYYGGLDKVEGWIFEEYGLNKEEFEEVA